MFMFSPGLLMKWLKVDTGEDEDRCVVNSLQVREFESVGWYGIGEIAGGGLALVACWRWACGLLLL